MLDSISYTSPVPVYLQVEKEIQCAIASGELKEGDSLPSVHQLSERLELNPNTVAKSYRDLEKLGLLFVRRGMGMFVKPGAQKLCQVECRKHAIKQFYETVAAAKLSGIGVNELKRMVTQCYAQDGNPYEPVPDKLIALAEK